MFLELPTVTFYIPTILFAYYWAWPLVALVGYAMWGAGRDVVASNWKSGVVKYTLIFFGWWVSLIFFVLTFAIGALYILKTFFL